MTSETLSSRERVIRMLNHEPVDRLPIDLGSHPSTGISAFAYWNLREHLGLSTDGVWLPDVVQMLAYVDEDVRQRLHVDCVMMEPRWEAARGWSPRGRYVFEGPLAMEPVLDDSGSWIVEAHGARMRMPAGGFFFDGSWLSDWSDGDAQHSLSLYAQEAKRIFEETPYATNFTGYSRGWGFSAFFGGMETLIEMMLNPKAVMESNARACESAIARAGKVIDAMGSHIQLLTISDDMGTQDGPMCRPSVVEQCVMPYIKRFCDFIHQNSDIKVFLHCCGSIKPYIPMLIDAGVDVLNPVQISAANMSPTSLAEEFGSRIVFWGGGCDTQTVLGVASPGEVGEHVKSVVRTFKAGGGFVFNQVHNIMGNVPPENILAMFDAAYEESFF